MVNKIGDPCNAGDLYQVLVGRDETLHMCNAIQIKVIELVAEQIARDILENNYAEIIEKISPEAIANMAIAESGAKISETLNKKLPDKILEIERNTVQVYQRGLLGGITRIK